jgi:hypothetical protein
MRRSVRLRLFPLAALLLAATACAESPAPAPPASQPPASPATATADAQPLKPPRMAVEPPPKRMPGAGDPIQRCDAEAARGAIGREATAEVVEEARLAAGADVVRTLSPGQMVTMEYHASRLTLDVDDANVVVDVRCG